VIQVLAKAAAGGGCSLRCRFAYCSCGLRQLQHRLGRQRHRRQRPAAAKWLASRPCGGAGISDGRVTSRVTSCHRACRSTRHAVAGSASAAAGCAMELAPATRFQSSQPDGREKRRQRSAPATGHGGGTVGASASEDWVATRRRCRFWVTQRPAACPQTHCDALISNISNELDCTSVTCS